MTVQVSDDELATRRAAWKQPALKATKGLLFKYALQVKDASQGCVTDEL
jgi:dihydroxy-acid dehydratase